MTPKYDKQRGRHKKRASLETREWEAKHLPVSPPAWMDLETWRKLVALRKDLDVLA